jgi:PAS domain S-box-containing protein
MALPRAFAVLHHFEGANFLRDRTLERTIGVTLVLGVIAGIALIAADRYAYQRLSEGARWSAHTSDVLYVIEGVSASHAEAEANERAYLLTADPTFLQRYRSIVTTWIQSVAELTALTADDPHQQVNCAKLKELVDLRRDALDRTIAIRDASGIAAATPLINDPERARVTNDLQQVMADMTAHERTLLEQRLTAERDAQVAMLASEGTAVAALFLVLLGGFVWLRRELRARLASREILDLLPGAVFTVSGVADGGRISYLNNQACQMFGYEHCDLANQSIDLLVPASVRDQYLRHRTAYAQNPTLRTTGAGLDLLGRRRDGSEFPIDVQPKFLDDSAEGATIAIVRDMTTVQAMRAAHERQLQTLIDNVPIAIAYMDQAERLQLANKEFRSIAPYHGDPRGMPVGTVLGDAMYELTQESGRALAGERASTVMPVVVKGQQRIHEVTHVPDRDSAGAILGDWKLRHKDGPFVSVQLSGTALPDGRLLGFVRDITEPKGLEDALRLARDSAVQANEVKSKFLAAASHDLRQPLQTIWSLQAVLTRAFKDTAYAPQLALLGDAVRNMDQMLSALIDTNRLEKGAIQPVILRNLLGNAIKHTQRGAIHLRVGTDSSQLYIDIVDTGSGIPTEHLKRIFDAFNQVDNPNRDSRQGVGLDLSIVQTICRLLGHEVAIESRPGESSTFTVQIARGVAAELPHEPVPIAATIAAAPSSGATIPHIEVRGLRPDLILSDFQLPMGFTGPEIVADIATLLGFKLPTIMLTGDNADSTSQRPSSSSTGSCPNQWTSICFCRKSKSCSSSGADMHSPRPRSRKVQANEGLTR